MDGYAYQSLPEAERKLWGKRWEGDEVAGSFCNTFGPEKVPANISEFLGYFMVRKVVAGTGLLKATGTVTRKLLMGLEDKNLIEDQEAESALVVVDDLGPELPRAEQLSYLLGRLCLEPPSGRLLEEWEDEYAEIVKVEPGKIWFRGDYGGGEVVGPVIVPKTASDLAKVGWSVSAVYLVRAARGWRMSELGNVYPSDRG